MRSTTRQQNPANRGLTAPARLARPLVYEVLELKEATFPIGVDVVGNRRAAESDGLQENLAQRETEPLKLGESEPVTPAARPDARLKQAFVGVDIAHACEDRLIEQRRFDR